MANHTNLTDLIASEATPSDYNITGETLTSHRPIDVITDAKMYAMRNHVHNVQVMSNDLPETLANARQRVSVYLPHLTYNHSNTRGSIDNALLASLQSSSKSNMAQGPFFSDMWFKATLIACVVIMILTLTLRFALWQRHHKKIMYRTIPAMERRRPKRFYHRPRITPKCDDDIEQTFVGVSIPLLHEVSNV